jgi:hypothetical protein
MVDPVLSEQNTIDVQAKPEAKGNRRRTIRRNRKEKKENVVKPEAQVNGEEEKEYRRPQQQRRRQQRAPKVATGESNQVREKADYTDGTLYLKISSNRPRTIYTRLARLMLAGYDGSGNALEGLKKPIEVIEVSALGNAIGSAIFVADNLMKGKVVEQVGASVEFVNFENQSSDESGKIRGSPRLVLTLRKLSNWQANKDEVLNKTRVFRSKVLGLPEEQAISA